MIRAVGGSWTDAQPYREDFCSHPGSDKILLPPSQIPSRIVLDLVNQQKDAIGASPAPQNYAGNEVLALLFSWRKNLFFSRKSFFRNILGFFLTPQGKDFRVLTRSSMCTYLASLPLAGHLVSEDTAMVGEGRAPPLEWAIIHHTIRTPRCRKKT